MTGTTDAPPAVRPGGAPLLRYRVMAYVVGTLLVVLAYGFVTGTRPIEKWVGIAHGYLYMVMLLTIFDLWRRRRFPFRVVLLVAVSGLVPLLTFYAEHRVNVGVREGRY